MPKFSDDELSRLSDEERAAIEGDADDNDILSSIANDDDELPGENNPDDENLDADPDPAPNDALPENDETVIPAEFVPEFKNDAPADADERILALDEQSKDVAAKFKDGEIDLTEFMELKGKIDQEKITLTVAIEQGKWSERQNAEVEQQLRVRDTNRFFSAPANKVYRDDEILYSVLDNTVRKLQAAPETKDKPYSWHLEEADRQVRARLVQGVTKPNRQPDLSGVPKSLSTLPAADLNDASSGGEFAYLDKLGGMDLERALAKLTPDQEARYLGVV